MNLKLIGVFAGLILFGMTGMAQASLSHIGWAFYDYDVGDNNLNRGAYKLIYDDDLQLTWLDYSNPRDQWAHQLRWAAGLNNHGVLVYEFEPGVTVNWAGNDWRLTDAGGVYPDSGYNVTTSEMGHLYYDERAPGAELNDSEFNNLLESWYWTGNLWAQNDVAAWHFDMESGYQGGMHQSELGYGIAVRSGQVSTAPVPGTIVLLASGLVGLVTVRTRRNGNRC